MILGLTPGALVGYALIGMVTVAVGITGLEFLIVAFQ